MIHATWITAMSPLHVQKMQASQPSQLWTRQRDRSTLIILSQAVRKRCLGLALKLVLQLRARWWGCVAWSPTGRCCHMLMFRHSYAPAGRTKIRGCWSPWWRGVWIKDVKRLVVAPVMLAGWLWWGGFYDHIFDRKLALQPWSRTLWLTSIFQVYQHSHVKSLLAKYAWNSSVRAVFGMRSQ